MVKSNDRSQDRNASNDPTESSVPEIARRGWFLQMATGALSLLLAAVPAGLGMGFLLDPLLRKRQTAEPSSTDSNARKDDQGFLRLDITSDALPADGTPVAYKVHDDKVDAWNRFTQIEVGTIWLRRMNDGSVLALNAICPHLGCQVDHRVARQDFFCPCHTSSFDLDGNRTNQIPPRPMDRLEVRLKPETGTTIWLKYENYRAGTSEKIAIS
jgi:menaquinol-cytochrome c reductase iron-sulfur subunit